MCQRPADSAIEPSSEASRRRAPSDRPSAVVDNLRVQGVYINPDGSLSLNPGTQGRVSVPELTPELHSKLTAYAAIRGLLLNQEAVPWTYLQKAASDADANATALSVGHTLTTDESAALARRLGSDV